MISFGYTKGGMICTIRPPFDFHVKGYKMDSRIIVDLDKMPLDRAVMLASSIGSNAAAYKVHSLADMDMAVTVAALKDAGAGTIMLDWKEKDMPDTIEQRAAKAKAGGADWLTVHADGGPDMIRKAKESGLYIIAITLLTSLTDDMVRHLYVAEPDEVVRKLAIWAFDGGANALVCSAKQVANLNKWRSNYAACDSWNMKLIVPGTRSAGVSHHDQKQVTTPYEAILNGADYLVGGRQITQAKDPLTAMKAMDEEIQPAIEARIAASTWRS